MAVRSSSGMVTEDRVIVDGEQNGIAIIIGLKYKWIGEVLL